MNAAPHLCTPRRRSLSCDGSGSPRRQSCPVLRQSAVRLLDTSRIYITHGCGSRVADWHWEAVTDDLLDGREFTGEPPGLRTVQRGPLMLAYLTDVRSERVVIIQVNWIG